MKYTKEQRIELIQCRERRYYQDYQEGIDKMACDLSVEGLEFKSCLLLIGRVALRKLFYTH